MIFSLDVRRARKGDCLLLHFGTKRTPGLILIDGGPRGVYKPHLKPRILEIKTARNLSEDDELPVDLLMVSHVDDDHIQGILEMTKELIESKSEKQPLLVRCSSIWHNSFDDIIDKSSERITAAVSERFGAQAATSGQLPSDATLDSEEAEDVVIASLKVLSSIAQGFQLRSDAQKLKIERNPEFGGDLILAREGNEPIQIGDGLQFTVLGPMPAELEVLRKKHNDWLKKLKKDGKSPGDALAAYVDKSVHNLSSVVVLAQSGKRSMLLTGDARGDKILEGLELTGVIEQGGRLEVSLLKVPHHGSANNLDNDFFERIIADHYVFSGNGEHGNPEREALEMLLEARGEDANYTIHLTYAIEEIDEERKKDWEKEQAKERKKGRTPRKDWTPKEHSLAALFKAHPKLKKRVKVVPEDKAHVIDLGDPL